MTNIMKYQNQKAGSTTIVYMRFRNLFSYQRLILSTNLLLLPSCLAILEVGHVSSLTKMVARTDAWQEKVHHHQIVLTLTALFSVSYARLKQLDLEQIHEQAEKS